MKKLGFILIAGLIMVCVSCATASRASGINKEDVTLEDIDFYWYTVQHGDSMSLIAQNHGVNMRALVLLNLDIVPNIRALQEGVAIRIPIMDAK